MEPFMTSVAFLKAVLPPLLVDEWYIHGRKLAKGFSHTACRTVEALAEYALQESNAGYDSYFALGSFYEEHLHDSSALRITARKPTVTRITSAARAYSCLWLDLDCGDGKEYASQDEAQSVLAAFVQETGLAYTYVVSSGNGLHVYWAFTYPYFMADNFALAYLREWYPDADDALWAQNKTQYRLYTRNDLAGRFYSICHAFGLKYDRAAVDATRVLRVPGTMNHKDPDNPKPVAVIKENGAPWVQTEFNALCDDIISSKGITVQIKQQTSAQPKLTGAAAEELRKLTGENVLVEGLDRIVQGCEQLRDMGVAPEPLWRDAICLCLQCEDGADWAHKLSAQDTARYSQTETDEYIARSSPYAVRCSTFASKRENVCERCAYYGKVVTPLQIARYKEEEETVQAADAAQLPPLVFPPYEPQPVPYTTMGGTDFFCNDKGLWRKVVDQNGNPQAPLHITDLVIEYLYGIMGANKINDDTTMAYDVYRVYHPLLRRSFIRYLPLKFLIDTRKTMEWCANNRMVSPESQKALAEFMNAYSRQAWKYGDSTRLKYGAYGWQEDGGFVLDKYIITKAGARPITPTAIDLEEREYPFTQKGDLAVWKKIPELYKTLDQPLGQLAMCMAFAAPFMQYGVGEAKNCVLNIYSFEGGVGKSHLLKACASVYGNPANAFLQNSASSSAIQRIMATYKHLPVFIDEIGNRQDDQLAELIFTAINGVEKQKLNRDSTRRQTGRWSTVVFTTANRPLKDVMSRVYASTDAGVLRVMDCACDFAKSCDEAHRQLVGESFELLDKHYGVAGAEFLYCVMNDSARLDSISARANAFAVNNNFSAQERFYSYPLAIALIIGRWAVEYGLLPYDMDRLEEWVLHTLVSQLRSDDTALVYNPLDDLGEFINAGLRKNCLVVTHSNRPAEAKPMVTAAGVYDPYVIQYPMADLVMRYELDTKTFMFSQRAFSLWCAKNGRSVRHSLKKLRAEGWIGMTSVVYNLGKGVTRYVSTKVKCHVLTQKFVTDKDLQIDSADCPMVPVTQLTSHEAVEIEKLAKTMDLNNAAKPVDSDSENVLSQEGDALCKTIGLE